MREGGTPLYLAAQNNHVAVVVALLAAGALVDKEMDNGSTPLILAIQQGHEAVMNVLLEAHADVNKAAGNGITPLMIASCNGGSGSEAIVVTLLELGASRGRQGDGGRNHGVVLGRRGG